MYRKRESQNEIITKLQGDRKEKGIKNVQMADKNTSLMGKQVREVDNEGQAKEKKRGDKQENESEGGNEVGGYGLRG